VGQQGQHLERLLYMVVELDRIRVPWVQEDTLDSHLEVLDSWDMPQGQGQLDRPLAERGPWDIHLVELRQPDIHLVVRTDLDIHTADHTGMDMPFLVISLSGLLLDCRDTLQLKYNQ
jgi:hypothetical protein